MDEVVESLPKGERGVIGADLNGHVGEGNRGDGQVWCQGEKCRRTDGGGFCTKDGNGCGEYVFQAYKSGGRSTEVDYVLCRRCNLKAIGDSKVVAGECNKAASDGGL